MPFPWTLQRYILREMGKTFLLAAVALTAVLGLGGGVLNMIKMGAITPWQLFRLMGLVLPLGAALTLPIAALFSATSTYGRLSADNEFVACRSSGINMHVLFLPTLVLSLLAAGASFAFTNLVIPRMVHNLNAFVGSDFSALIRQQVNQPRGINLGGRYRIHADECVTDPANPDRLVLRGVAFVEVDGQDWVRYGTIREIWLTLDQTDTPARLAAVALGVSWYDRDLGQFVESERQTIASTEIPTFVPQKIKFLNLNELSHYLANPTLWHEVRRKMQRLRTAAGRVEVHKRLWNDWEDDHVLTLSDKELSYVVRAARAAHSVHDNWIELEHLTIEERRGDRRQSITAERAQLEVTRGDTLSECGVRIDLYNARFGGGARRPVQSKAVLGPVAIAHELIARVGNLSDAELLDPKTTPPNDPLADKRTEARSERDKTVRRIVGAINERMAFSVSVFVLVILGAALGIVFRGSHVMTSFGISFIPALFVIVAIVTGKQMSQNAATHALGLMLMWGGIVFVAALDVWVLTRVVRR